MGTAAAVLAACGSSPATGTSGGATGTFNVTVAVDLVTQNLDPYTSAPSTSGAISFGPAFDTLTRLDPTSQLKPGLATSWKNTGPTAWEFTLREGVKFAAGQDFNAAVVKFNVDRLLSKAGQAVGAFASFQSTIAGAEVVSPTVVRLTTKQPDPQFARRLSLFWMVGPDYPDEPGAPPYNDKTNGTGPFQVSAFRPGQSIEYTHNPTAWRLADTPNRVRNVKLVQVAETNARIAALRNNEADVIFSITAAEQMLSLSGPEFTLIRSEGDAGRSIRFDQLHVPADSPVKNKLVRQALEFAIDRDALNKAAYGSLYATTGQVAPKGIFGYSADIKPRPFDVPKAKELLAQAGYPNGFQMVLNINDALQPEALALQGMWQKIGVEAKIAALELAAFAQASNSGKLGPAGTFAMAWPLLDADSVLVNYSNAVPEPRHAWSNAQFNEIYAASVAEFDIAKREKLLQQASLLLQEEAAVIPLARRLYIWGVRTGLSWTTRTDPRMDFETFTKA